jgi:hypothetical protein
MIGFCFILSNVTIILSNQNISYFDAVIDNYQPIN